MLSGKFLLRNSLVSAKHLEPILHIPWWDLISCPAFSATGGEPELIFCLPLHGVDVSASASSLG